MPYAMPAGRRPQNRSKHRNRADRFAWTSRVSARTPHMPVVGPAGSPLLRQILGVLLLVASGSAAQTVSSRPPVQAVPTASRGRRDAGGPRVSPRLHVRASPTGSGRIEVVLDGPAVGALRRQLGSRPNPDQVEPLFYFRMAQGEVRVPMFARLEWRGSTAVLVPQAPLTRGVAYEAVFEGSRVAADLPRVVLPHRVPADASLSSARITAVHPTQAELPANLLKFYVHFSAPMAQGQLFRFTRLLDGAGKPIEQAFHEVELWSQDHRRVTILINPGRTKHALGLSEALGPVLRERRHYTLEIRAGLPDQQGRPLARPWRHSFRTADFDGTSPRVDTWTLTPPKAGTRTPFRVQFPEPLDHALCDRLLSIVPRRREAGGGLPGRGEPLAGRGTVAPDGTGWSFVPDRPWDPGAHRLVAAGDLEDLAGNNLVRPFEVPAGKGARPPVIPPTFAREFLVTR